MKSALDHWPDWCDAGKPVRALMYSGRIVTGRIEITDFFPTDDGDEVPVFAITDATGRRRSFGDVDAWEFITARVGRPRPAWHALLTPELLAHVLALDHRDKGLALPCYRIKIGPFTAFSVSTFGAPRLRSV